MQLKENKSGIQVIARAAAILRCLKNKTDGLSLGEIAEIVELPRSTVQRIVSALQKERLLISASPGRGIRLGPELSSLAESARIDLTDILRPYLVKLAKIINETVDLAVLRGKRMIFVDQIPGTHRLRTVSSVGDAFPMTETANGKACLAKLSDETVKKILLAERPAFCENKDNVVSFLNEMDEIRTTGLAYDRNEHTLGICAIGVAFKDFQGNLYAISTPIPSSRFEEIETKLVENLLKALIEIENLEVVTKQ